MLSRTATAWTDTIFDFMERYPNVYTDFSYNGVSPNFFTYLQTLLDAQNKGGRSNWRDRILFGTDFMINLRAIPPYRDYYRQYENSPLNPNLRHRFRRLIRWIF